MFLREGQRFSLLACWSFVLFLFLFILLSHSHQTVLYVTLRVLKEQLTLDVLQGDLDRSAPAYTMVQPSADAIPLTLGAAGSHEDDDIMDDEYEFDHAHKNNTTASNGNHDIEMSAFGHRHVQPGRKE